ncbi:DUF3833 domain-containing protein [Alteromonas sp. AMM-1]|uniref:DUF3833 domain-containing protein n=1 Tax=Alteromonas sp. AMM-1 TaxID=3394233 RepID=UPI0039A6DAA7
MRYLLGLLLCVGMAGCSVSIEGDTYKQQTPEFSLEQFFTGEVKAWGIVQNRSGEVVQRFTVDISGTKDGNVLVLDERFTYSLGDGPASRVWRITPQINGTYTGQASDILDVATGTPYGNAFNFTYSMDLPVDDTTYTVAFDDWFWALDNDTLMNRSYIKKFGLVMAEVTIFMQRQ